MSEQIEIKESEVKLSAIKSQGAGGQHVNKVSSAIHLRFDIGASSLPQRVKERFLASKDTRISKEGVFVMKVQDSRSQDMNRMFAWSRLDELVQAFGKESKIRRATKVKKSSIEKRLKEKKKRSVLKSSRGLVVA
jgi:ribosome-associated protein